jgi:catechol 2,3-dioxygenase-like lactoylglutathione lyase family enzyme
MRIKRIDHMSFTVGNIEESAAFYRRLGYEPFKRYVSAGTDADEGTDTPNAEIDINWLRHPAGGPMLELLRYQNKPVEAARHNSEVGAAHICLCVDDVKGAYAELDGDGIKFISAPHTDEFGVSWVYMRDPDGNAVELIEDA